MHARSSHQPSYWLNQKPGWAAGSSPVRMDGLEPKKKSGSSLGFRPRPKLLLAKGVFGKTDPYAFFMYFIPFLF